VVSTGLRFNACVERFGGPKNVLTTAYGLTEVSKAPGLRPRMTKVNLTLKSTQLLFFSI
jgi:hypothetical protein